MCPSCGAVFETEGSIVPDHVLPGASVAGGNGPVSRVPCAGSGQHARNPDTDRRFLWNGNPNPHMSDFPSWAEDWGLSPTTTTTSSPAVMKLEPVGIDSDGSVKPVDQIPYTSRLHVDDLIGNILHAEHGMYPSAKLHPLGKCSHCRRSFELTTSGEIPGHNLPTRQEGDTIVIGYCPGSDKPPDGDADTPHIVDGSK